MCNVAAGTPKPYEFALQQSRGLMLVCHRSCYEGKDPVLRAPPLRSWTIGIFFFVLLTGTLGLMRLLLTMLLVVGAALFVVASASVFGGKEEEVRRDNERPTQYL